LISAKLVDEDEGRDVGIIIDLGTTRKRKFESVTFATSTRSSDLTYRQTPALDEDPAEGLEGGPAELLIDKLGGIRGLPFLFFFFSLSFFIPHVSLGLFYPFDWVGGSDGELKVRCL
jgi:hypothetical protein